MVAHLCMCPNKDRVKLLTEGVDKLKECMEKQDKIDPEISYWLLLYIKFQGTRRFQDLGRMTPNMTALTLLKDAIHTPSLWIKIL
jgi:hypothetical protein